MSTSPVERRCTRPEQPGNLSKEQQIALRKFWHHLFILFDLLPTSASLRQTEGTKTGMASASKKSDDIPIIPSKNTTKNTTNTTNMTIKTVDSPKPKSTKDPDQTSSVLAKWKTLYSNEPTTNSDSDFLESLTLQPSTLRLEFWKMCKHDFPDLLAIRFLRARSYDPERAITMLFSTLVWRSKNIERAANAEKAGEEEVLKALEVGKSMTYGYDKEGRTITLIRMRKHARGDITPESLERYTVYAMELGHLLHLPTQDRTVLLVDMTDFSVRNLDFAAIKFIIGNFENHYPEALSEGIIHNAPWIFGASWNIVKGLLDPYTRSKVSFTASVDELAKKIGPEMIPKEMKGKTEIEYKYVQPAADENLVYTEAEKHVVLKRREEEICEFEEVTKRWILAAIPDENMSENKVKHGTTEVTHGGGPGGGPGEGKEKEKEKEIEKKIEKERMEKGWVIADGYWIVDPYIRNKSYYDRLGLLPPSHARPSGNT